MDNIVNNNLPGQNNLPNTGSGLLGNLGGLGAQTAFNPLQFNNQQTTASFSNQQTAPNTAATGTTAPNIVDGGANSIRVIGYVSKSKNAVKKAFDTNKARAIWAEAYNAVAAQQMDNEIVKALVAAHGAQIEKSFTVTKQGVSSTEQAKLVPDYKKSYFKALFDVATNDVLKAKYDSCLPANSSQWAVDMSENKCTHLVVEFIGQDTIRKAAGLQEVNVTNSPSGAGQVGIAVLTPKQFMETVFDSFGEDTVDIYKDSRKVGFISITVADPKDESKAVETYTKLNFHNIDGVKRSIRDLSDSSIDVKGEKVAFYGTKKDPSTTTDNLYGSIRKALDAKIIPHFCLTKGTGMLALNPKGDREADSLITNYNMYKKLFGGEPNYLKLQERAKRDAFITKQVNDAIKAAGEDPDGPNNFFELKASSNGNGSRRVYKKPSKDDPNAKDGQALYDNAKNAYEKQSGAIAYADNKEAKELGVTKETYEGLYNAKKSEARSDKKREATESARENRIKYQTLKNKQNNNK